MKKFLSTVVIGTALVAGSVSSAFALDAKNLLTQTGSKAQSNASKVVLQGVYNKSNNSIDVSKKALIAWAKGNNGRLNIGPNVVPRMLTMANTNKVNIDFNKAVALRALANDGTSVDFQCGGAILTSKGLNCKKIKFLSNKKDEPGLDGKVIKVQLLQNS